MGKNGGKGEMQVMGMSITGALRVCVCVCVWSVFQEAIMAIKME